MSVAKLTIGDLISPAAPEAPENTLVTAPEPVEGFTTVIDF